MEKKHDIENYNWIKKIGTAFGGQGLIIRALYIADIHFIVYPKYCN